MPVDRRQIARVVLLSLFGIIITPLPPRLTAEDFSQKEEILQSFHTASESAKLIRSLRYRMVLRSPEFARELEFWMKDSKYRVRVPKVHVHTGGSTSSTASNDHCGDEQVVSNANSWTYFAKDGSPSPLPTGLPHLAQFEWLFDDFTAGRWPVVQDPFAWKRALEMNEICTTVRQDALDGLPAKQIILYHPQCQYRLDVWLVESLGMYPMKIESLDRQRKILHSSVVEKYMTFQIGEQCTVIPTRVRELRTSPLSVDDPTYNIFEIVPGSLEINPDLPDELFAAVEEPLPEVEESTYFPVRDYRQVPTSEPERAIAPFTAATPDSVVEPVPVTKPSHKLPVLPYLLAATATCTVIWGIRRSALQSSA